MSLNDARWRKMTQEVTGMNFQMKIFGAAAEKSKITKLPKSPASG